MTITALITPFRDGKVDFEGLRANIEFQIANGINALFVMGSTGETPTLLDEEQEEIIATTVHKVNGRVPVWVGTGCNSTRETIEKTRRARDLGADVVCIVVPYYNKPTQEGIFRHFEAISIAVDIPIILYNIPGRTGVNVEPQTLARIAALRNVIGVKESTGNLVQLGEDDSSHSRFSVLFWR